MFFEETNGGTILRVRISPNSSSVSVRGIFVLAEGQEFLKVNVISVPEKGRANRELLDFLAKKLNIAKSRMEIISGETDRYKKILIIGDADLEEIERLNNG